MVPEEGGHKTNDLSRTAARGESGFSNANVVIAATGVHLVVSVHGPGLGETGALVVDETTSP